MALYPTRILSGVFAIALLPFIAAPEAARGAARLQDEAAKAPEVKPGELELRPRIASGNRYLVFEESRYEDRLVRIEVRAGDEVLFLMDESSDQQSAPAGFALNREIEVERKFDDKIQAAADAAGGQLPTSLERTYHRLHCKVSTKEKGTSRGPRVKEIDSDLKGRVLTITRSAPGEKVTTAIRPRPRANPQEQQPPDPPAEDLALGFIESHLEQLLPVEKVSPGASWKLGKDAVRVLLGGTDGYPFPRAEKLSGGFAGVERGRDPISVFLERGAIEALASLGAPASGIAPLELKIVISLKDVDLYKAVKAENADEKKAAGKEEASGQDATSDEQAEKKDEAAQEERKSDSLVWPGTITCSGTAQFDLDLGVITEVQLEGKIDFDILGRGPEGPGQSRLDLKLEGALDRSIRIHRVGE